MLMVLLMVDESAGLMLRRTCPSAGSKSHVNKHLRSIFLPGWPLLEMFDTGLYGQLMALCCACAVSFRPSVSQKQLHVSHRALAKIFTPDVDFLS